MARRQVLVTLALAALALAIALPALAANPAAPGQAKGPKASKAPEIEVTLSGTVRSTTDADGKTSYTMTNAGTTYTLDAGPSWFHGDNHPLKAFVDKSVTIVGEHPEGSTELDVLSVDGTALRAAGKPPWAGGWKKVGEKHPGWSQAKADRMQAKFGDCFPPGRCKVKTNGQQPSATPRAEGP